MQGVAAAPNPGTGGALWVSTRKPGLTGWERGVGDCVRDREGQGRRCWGGWQLPGEKEAKAPSVGVWVAEFKGKRIGGEPGDAEGGASQAELPIAAWEVSGPLT